MYKKIKIAVYLIGILFVIYFYFRDGLISTHTPPLTFIFSLITLGVSVVWINVDYILSHLLSIYKTRFLEHQISIGLNLIYILSIISYV